MNFINYLSFLLVFVIVLGCNSNQQETIKVAFNVKTELLEPIPYVNKDLNFSVNAPKNWKRGESLIETKSNNIVLEVFTHLKDSSTFLILNYSDLSNDIYKSLKDNKSEASFKESEWVNVQKAEFVYNDFDVTQYVLQGVTTLKFKLFLETEDINSEHIRLGFDYLLPLASNKQFNSIESSIGSLKKNH